MATAAVLRPAAGAIRDDETYPLESFKEITGLGSSAIRAMRRQGFAVKYTGGRAFIDGAEFRRFINENGKSEK
jgi:hypothetical protein